MRIAFLFLFLLASFNSFSQEISYDDRPNSFEKLLTADLCLKDTLHENISLRIVYNLDCDEFEISYLDRVIHKRVVRGTYAITAYREYYLNLGEQSSVSLLFDDNGLYTFIYSDNNEMVKWFRHRHHNKHQQYRIIEP